MASWSRALSPFGRRPASVLLPLSVSILALSACAGGGGRGAQPAVGALEPGFDAETALHALLLLLEDRRQEETVTQTRALEGGEGLRAHLARASGRIGGDDTELLDSLIVDPSPRVRREAAFGWAWYASHAVPPLPPPGDAEALWSALADPDPVTAGWAIEALAARRAPLDRVVARLSAVLDESALWRRLLPSLHRFPDDDVHPVATLALERVGEVGLPADDVAVLRRRAALAWLDSHAAPPLDGWLALARDPDPWLRAETFRHLPLTRGIDDGESVLARLEPDLLPAAGTAAAVAAASAWGAAERLLGSGRVAAPEDWRALVSEAVVDPRPGLRLAAQRTASFFLPDATLAERLVHRAAAGDAEAVRALALGRVEGAYRAADDAIASGVPRRVVAGLDAAERLAAPELFERALRDSRPSVRATALTVSLRHRPLSAWPTLLRTALQDPALAVRTAALEALVVHPVLALDEVMAAAAGSDDVALGLAAVEALAAIAEQRTSERGGALLALERLAERGRWSVRAHAARRLVALGLPRPELGAAAPLRPGEYYRGILARTLLVPDLRLETVHGDLDIRLDCERAPLSCVSLLQLAAQGFYDGLPFDLEPGLALTGGDPRGDGHGDPGYRLRDEPVPLRFDRPGVFGLERPVPDAGGSRFFVTLAPRPELEGRSVALGEVVAGHEVLSRLGPGDRVVRLRALAVSLRSEPFPAVRRRATTLAAAASSAAWDRLPPGARDVRGASIRP